MDHTIAHPLKEKRKMAEGKLAWSLFNILGGSATLLTVFGDLGEPYKTIVSILAIIFMVITILRSYEKWQEMRISNKERIYDLKRKHIRDAKNSHA